MIRLSSYIVILDTNILFSQDKREVVDPEFDKFWGKYLSNFDMELIIPEVVKGELLFQQFSSTNKFMKIVVKNLSTISQITEKKYHHNLSESKIKKQIETRFNKWLKNKKGKIENTPINSINWSKIVNNAIWRIPPFEHDIQKEVKEKGFRDALILETIIEFCKQDKSEHQIVFLCNDQLLRTTTEKELITDERVSCFDTIEGFKSYLKLTHEKFTNKIIKVLLKKATSTFFTVGSNNCIYYKENIPRMLNDKFKKFFEDPTNSLSTVSSEGKWNSLNVGKNWISNPQFSMIKDKNIYRWTSPIHFAQQFTREPTPGMSLARLSELIDLKKVLVLHFNVIWEVKIYRDGRFMKSRVIDTELINNSFESLTPELIRRFQLS